MHNTPHSNHPKTTKFDVMLLSEADMALLNNESPQTFNEEYKSAVTSSPPLPPPSGNHWPYAPDNNTSREQLSPFSSEIHDPTDLVFSSISETRFFQPIPPYNSNDLNDVLKKTVASEPLLTEEDLLYLVKKEYTGSLQLSRRTIKQALVRNNLQTGYKRLQAYMTDKSYE